MTAEPEPRATVDRIHVAAYAVCVDGHRAARGPARRDGATGRILGIQQGDRWYAP